MHKRLTCSSLSYRSPTEKLLVEMFSGVSAQFLAVLETLTESWRRPLNQAPPSTVPDLDHETVLDIYQVSVCSNTLPMNIITLNNFSVDSCTNGKCSLNKLFILSSLMP